MCQELHHICGNDLYGEGHPLHETVVTRRMLKCSDPVELQYFSSPVSFPDVCYFCGEVKVNKLIFNKWYKTNIYISL